MPTPIANHLRLEVLRRRPDFAQYLAIRYTDRLAQAGAVNSVGSKGDSFDNALAETVNGLYKAELIHHRGPWRTVEDVELATLSWVHWWNTARLHESLGHVPPVEFETNWHQTGALYGPQSSPTEPGGMNTPDQTGLAAVATNQ